MGIGDMIGRVVASSSAGGTYVSISKVDNGFLVDYVKMPTPPKEAATPRPVSPMPDVDEMMDKLVDGLGAFLRQIHNDGAGEDWKGSEDREKVRAGLRLMFPQLEQQLERAYAEPPPPPRQERLVFRTVPELTAFLTELLAS